MEGHGRSRNWTWIWDLNLGLGFGTWIWNLDFGLDLGLTILNKVTKTKERTPATIYSGISIPFKTSIFHCILPIANLISLGNRD